VLVVSVLEIVMVNWVKKFPNIKLFLQGTICKVWAFAEMTGKISRKVLFCLSLNYSIASITM
jgi:hypothetical protein